MLVDEIVDAADAAVGRGRAAPPRAPSAGDAATIADDVRSELATAVGPGKVARYESRLADAGRAFRAERFGDAARILRNLARDAPGAASVRELYGLTLYRQQRWRDAIRELEAFRFLTGSTEQHPVLADCYRALGAHDQVADLWRELRAASPGAELVTEGRIVAAGDLADQGDLAGAKRLLEQGFRLPGRPREHHLRRAYALADVVERTGDVVRARDLFRRIDAAAPGFADVARRIRALS